MRLLKAACHVTSFREQDLFLSVNYKVFNKIVHKELMTARTPCLTTLKPEL